MTFLLAVATALNAGFYVAEHHPLNLGVAVFCGLMTVLQALLS